MIAEKPYIKIDNNGRYSIVVPAVTFNKVGPQDYSNYKVIDFSNVYVAKDTDSVSLINQKLSSGLHLILSPGQYNLSSPIVVGLNNTIVIGIGFPTLISTNGNSVLVVTGSEGVRVSGILLQAGAVEAPNLLVNFLILFFLIF